MRDLIHRPYGRLALDWLYAHDRCALWAKPGMGKTLIALSYLDTLHNTLGEDGQTLVLAPKRVAEDVWVHEVAKWRQLAGLEVVSATGVEKARAMALRRDAATACAVGRSADAVVIGTKLIQLIENEPRERVAAVAAEFLGGIRQALDSLRA